MYKTVRNCKIHQNLRKCSFSYTFSYIFLCFRTFSYVFIRFNFQVPIRRIYESQKIVDNRKKPQRKVRNCTKPYEICPNCNGFPQFCMVSYGFLRFSTFVFSIREHYYKFFLQRFEERLRKRLFEENNLIFIKVF